MSYLAYDPLRIAALAGATCSALEELRHLDCADPLAADAVGRVRLAAVHLDQLWIPLLERISRCDPLGAVDPSGLDAGDLPTAVMRAMADLAGWLVAETDPAALVADALPSAPLTVDGARALAEVLRHGELRDALDTEEERAWLAAELGMIAADPTLAAAFAVALERHGPLADELAHQRMALLGDEPTADVDDIDASFAALAHIDATVHGTGGLPALTRTMEPYAAAALIRQAALDPTTLAWLSVEVLHRLDNERPGMWPEDREPGPKTGDLLFETILATPGAPTPFVIAVRPEPQLLWWTAADAGLAQRVAREGTGPQSIGPVEAHLVLHAFTEWFVHLDGLARNNLRFTAHPFESRSALGELAAPWLVEFGPGTDDWGPDAGGRRSDLAFVIDDRAARDRLFARMDELGAALAGVTTRHRDDQAVAAAMGMLVQLEVERQVRAGEDAKESWDGGWELLSKVISYSGKQMGPEAAAIAKMANQALTEFKRLADRNGWLNAPRPPGDVAQVARAEQQRVLLGAAATAVLAGYFTLVDRGELAPTTPLPPVPSGERPDDLQAYWRAYTAWKEANLPEGSSAELVLDEQYHLFLSDADLGTRLPPS